MITLVICFLLLAALVFGGMVFAMIGHRLKPVVKPSDIFGFEKFRKEPPQNPPPFKRYPARDGEQLAFRFYDSTSDKILIFVHGSSYHGAAYNELAVAVSEAGAAKVVLPNMRGHYLSGRKRGDVDYVGQLEDDIADLIGYLRANDCKGPVYLGGHSSGGGFVIRFAGGAHAGLVSGYTMLSPIIPLPPFMLNGTSGGWANVNLPRIVALSLMNSLGVSCFNELEAINFNKPVEFRDGTETLAYSYNLNASYHPRYDYKSDLRAIRARAIVLVGDLDQAIDAEALKLAFERESPTTAFRILAGIDHFGVFTDTAAHNALIDWLKAESGCQK